MAQKRYYWKYLHCLIFISPAVMKTIKAGASSAHLIIPESWKPTGITGSHWKMKFLPSGWMAAKWCTTWFITGAAGIPRLHLTVIKVFIGQKHMPPSADQQKKIAREVTGMKMWRKWKVWRVTLLKLVGRVSKKYFIRI